MRRLKKRSAGDCFIVVTDVRRVVPLVVAVIVFVTMTAAAFERATTPSGKGLEGIGRSAAGFCATVCAAACCTNLGRVRRRESFPTSGRRH
jgi:hypothetical protein